MVVNFGRDVLPGGHWGPMLLNRVKQEFAINGEMPEDLARYLRIEDKFIRSVIQRVISFMRREQGLYPWS